MLNRFLMVALALTLINSEVFAGGGGKSNGTLVVKSTSQSDVAVVIDPPASLLALKPPFDTADREAIAKRATVIASGGSHSFTLKKGAHKVLAIDLALETFQTVNVTIASKATKKITVQPQ